MSVASKRLAAVVAIVTTLALAAVPAAPASPLPPVNLVPPAISGTAQQGQTLTVVAGKWANNPTAFTYQWLRCDATGNNCSPISAATNQTYLLEAQDVGDTIAVEETALNEAGTGGPARSLATVVVLPAPPPTPTTKEQCKNGGWRELADGSGTPFKNQGDCVSFVATGKHA